MTIAPITVIVAPALPSPARVRPSERAPLRVGAVQMAWTPDHDAHVGALSESVGRAAEAGARLVCLPELTLSPYFAASPIGAGAVPVHPESVDTGPTRVFATQAAGRHGVYVHASLWEADAAIAPMGWNTAICVAPDATLVAHTRKLHIPVTAGYWEDRYFVPGDTAYPVRSMLGASIGYPTCWDQWFPEVARLYSLAGAEVLVYPSAIGSEPDHPQFDTQPLWRQVIVGNGIANATFMIAVNRIGTEHVAGAPAITFYGSSFMSDPYGRVLVEAPRDRPAVIVADLDLDQRRDWLELFPFLRTRRPDTYGGLVENETGNRLHPTPGTQR